MRVDLYHPSRIDARVEQVEGGLQILPNFYQTRGNATIGILQATAEDGAVLDRAILQVSGLGKISISHRNSPVAPAADSTKNGGNDAKLAE